MFCAKCGIRVEEGQRFCQACGHEVGAPVIAVPATPEAVPPATMSGSTYSVPSFPYGTFWARLVAYLIDSLIVGLPSMIALFAAIFFLGSFGVMVHQTHADPDAVRAMIATLIPIFILGMLALMIIHWLYFAGMESSARQGTIGKSVMSLRVSDLEGKRISFGHATGRFFAKIVSGMIPFLIGYLMAAFTEKKQALHDLIAGTLVLGK
ncbi:MAG TPA: RDD family protein [Candidatus Saccharimonadales bacterium]|jgi:uncharacterized RDD family membrane protein YckC|nr:RDD family protein [Candidatus Saccharimonadales bacterium]